jgi:CRP/FNR family transcriptional regulator
MANSPSEIEEIKSKLGRFPLWDRVPQEVLAHLAAQARLAVVPDRRPLFMADHPSPGLFLVRRGEFKVTLISAEGREQILYLAEPGRLITESYTPSGANTHCAAFAREDSEAWELAQSDINQAASACPELGLALLESHCFRLNRHIDLVFQLSLLSVERRLAAFILELARRNHAEVGKPFVLRRNINVSTVACLLGTVREEVTRAQTRLQKRGIVEISRREVIIHDLEGLEALVNE